MASALPDTREKTFEQWAAGVCISYPEADIANFPYLPWQSWGLQLFQRQAFDSIAVPNPLHFGTWQEWGDQLRIVTDGLEQ